VLGRVLGPGEYGLVSFAVAVQTIFNTVHATGIPQAVSRRVAADPENGPQVLATALPIQFAATAASAILVVAMAAALWVARDGVAPYLAVAALNLVPHGLLNLHLGYAAGLHQFRRQALLLTCYSVAKVVVVTLLAFAFRGLGALVGYAIASFGTLLLGRYRTRRLGRLQDGRELVAFALPVIVFVGLSTLQLNVDLLLVQAIMGSSDQTGWYAAAQQIARAPYYALAGIGMALLPGVARRDAENDLAGLTVTVAQVVRYALILLAPAVTLLSVAATGVVELLYSDRYLPSATPLPALMPGMAALTLFSILAAVLTGLGRPRVAVVIAAGALATTVLVALLLIPRYGLVGAAAATTIGGVGALAGSLVVLGRALGTLVAPLTVLRAAGAAVAIGAVLAVLRPTGFGLIVSAVLLLAAYVVFLSLAGELRDDDWRRVRGLLPVRAE
jgi:O-antigen/teichoic acid export membrane protein